MAVGSRSARRMVMYPPMELPTTAQPRMPRWGRSKMACEWCEGKPIETWQSRARWEGALPSGGHTLRVSAPGMLAYQAELTIEDDKARRVPYPRTSDVPARVAREAYRRGAMVRISGPNMILSPPLTITRDEVDHLVDILEESFAAVEATL